MRDADARPSGRVRRWQWILGGFGVAVLGLAGVVFIGEVPLVRYPGVAAWLVGALVVHDGIVAGAVLAAGLLLRHARWRPVTKAIVGGAAAVGAIVALVVAPAVIKDALGTANPTVLPFDYLGNLLRFELGVVIVALIATVVARTLSARRGGSR